VTSATRAAYSGNIDPLAAKYCHVSVIIQDVDCFGRSLLIVRCPPLMSTGATPTARMASAARRISDVLCIRNPAKRSASEHLELRTSATGKSSFLSARKASSDISSNPEVEFMTGSTTGRSQFGFTDKMHNFCDYLSCRQPYRFLRQRRGCPEGLLQPCARTGLRTLIRAPDTACVFWKVSEVAPL